ncbi:MAG: hypothetical protein KGL02_01360 [Acidobacteriota bacterium]|nr:hypothetical protein [Acidobacteriota bacterium]
MFDAEKRLFCHRLVRIEQGLVREGLSPRYTIMTLLGLRELELAGIESSFDAQSIYKSFIRDKKWIEGIGDLGLLIWLTAAFDPGQLGSLLAAFDCDSAPTRYADGRQQRTMELAWFLAGLAHAAEIAPELTTSLTDLSVATYHRIEENQGESGFFGHTGVKQSTAGRLRGRIGSFADQVYPIYAISKFAQVFHVEDPLSPALECATAICNAQGPRGQWWWLYDSRAGRVSSRYPVYSVHQHGMAPMALFALERIAGQNFTHFIHKGLTWLSAANELSVDMIDPAQSVIWRCILPVSRHAKYRDMALNFIGHTSQTDQELPANDLSICFEQRPYEFGWLLFALARNSSSGFSAAASSD